MAFKEILPLLFMFEFAGLLSQHSFRKCTKEVSICPITEEQWYQRRNNVPCFGEGFNYTCMKAAGNVLVEACINEYSIIALTGSKCPFIHSCDGTEPVLAIEGNWPLCPEDVFGCPPADHPDYTVYHMYKYPACIVRNVSELLTTELPQKIESSPTIDLSNVTTVNETNRPTYGSTADLSNVTTVNETNRPAYGRYKLVIIAVLTTVGAFFALLSFIFCILRTVQSRKVRRNKKDEDIELSDNPQCTSDGSIPLLIDSGDSVPLFEETNWKRPCTPNDSETEEEHVNVTPDQGFYNDMKRRLLKFSKKVIQKIPMSPGQTFRNLPLQLMYADVVIKTDLRFVNMGHKYFEEAILEKEENYIKNPADLFYKNGEPTERIFMVGDAVHGKTTYCLWLLKYWYDTNNDEGNKTTQDEWRKEIGNFDFVFLVRLRDVKKSRARVIDMICKDILDIDDEDLRTWLEKTLKSGNYRSLILIDGLDEWKPNQDVTDDNKFKGIPILDDIENCVIFITMRPWKFQEVSKDVNTEDCVVKILGLNENGQQKVTENVLLNHFRLDYEKQEDKLIFDTIQNKFKNHRLASIMKIPLLAVLGVQIWYNGDEKGNSLTRFFTSMINMLMERTEEKNTTASNGDYTQNILNSNYKYKTLLLKLGKLAYEGLIAGRYIHEFYAKKVLEETGLTRSELDLSLDVGLLSREEAKSVMSKKVKLYFIQALFQEYLGAVYIVENEEIKKSFFERLSSVKDILQFNNVLVFLTGLNAQLGRKISKHIANVANADNEVSKYRECDKALFYRNDEVELLYKLQASCYVELNYTKSCIDAFKQLVPYHVTDVYVGDDNNIETIRATADILAYHSTGIKSLLMINVPTDEENGIPDSLLAEYLDRTVSLQSLYLDGLNTNRTLYRTSNIVPSLTALELYNVTLTPEAFSSLQTAIHLNTTIQTLGLAYLKIQINDQEGKPVSLSDIIPILPDLPCLTSLHIQIREKDKPVFTDTLSRLSNLHGIEYICTSPRDDTYNRYVVHTLCKWSWLRWFCLFNVNLADRGLQLQHNMLKLETIVLREVEMLPSAWNNFIQSLLNINHQFDIILLKVNIDEECLDLIRSSPQFRISQDEVADVKTCRHILRFIRVFPPSE